MTKTIRQAHGSKEALLKRLEQDNGFVIRKTSNFDRLFAMDRKMMFKFLSDTQPDTLDYLRKIYKSDLEDVIVNFINAEVTKAKGSLIEVLKHSVKIANRKLDPDVYPSGDDLQF